MSFALAARLAANSLADDCRTWRDPPTLGAIADFAFAYDATRGVAVLFGGITHNYADLGETWEWDGTTWSLRATDGPSPRCGAGMCYDANRGVTVLFGGGDHSLSMSGETWEWDGAVWRLRSSAGPSPRWGLSLVYDSDRGVTVLFGGGHPVGSATERYGDTWEWDGATWTQRNVPGPSPRIDHGMAFDPTRAVSLLFGGSSTGANFDSETWEWDGECWTQRAATGPVGRWASTMTYDAAFGAVVLFGGYAGNPNGGMLADTWTWDGNEWAQRGTTGPSRRVATKMVFDARCGSTVLLGGHTITASNEFFSDLWEWRDATWRMIGQTRPTLRTTARMVYDSSRSACVLFGGRWELLAHYSYPADTWNWNGKSWILSGGAGPIGREGYGLAFDSRRHVTVLFGGYSRGRLGDTWEWDGGTWTQRIVDGPGAREYFVTAYDSARGVTYLYGGTSATGEQTDTWSWDGDQWRLIATAGVSTGLSKDMVYDARRGVCVLYANADFPVSRTETWEWDGAAWSRRSIVGPTNEYGFRLVYDDAKQAVEMVGRSADAVLVWKWDGFEWTTLNTNSPPSRRQDFAAAFDARRRTIVIFGGTGGYDETWEVRSYPACDANCDGSLSSADIAPFISALAVGGGCSPCAGDADENGTVNLFDINAFVACLSP